MTLSPSITFDGISTLTLSEGGIYVVAAALSFAAGTPALSYFGLSVSGGALIAPSTTADTIGQITVLRVANYAPGDTIQVINGSGNPVTLANATGVIGSAGHFTLYRIADGGL
jgi:hypothetical protein